MVGERKPWSAQLAPVLYLPPLPKAENHLQFSAFDADYVQNLCAGDPQTQAHFVTYFSQSSHAIEDLRQETFARVLASLSKGGALRSPEALGSFVNSVCNNVLLEHYRQSSRSQSLDEEGQPELPSADPDMIGVVAAKQLRIKVREILLEMPVRDRALLKAVFLDEKDRDEVCREFGVDREYLRVLLFRAKQEFKTEYLKRVGTDLFAGQA
jgi:RNA polymerase sigma-70 factor (ECF subfamily)